MDNLQKFNKKFYSFILKNVLFYNVATRLVRSQILKQRGSVLFSPVYLPVSTQSPYSYNPFIQSLLGYLIIAFFVLTNPNIHLSLKSFSIHLQIFMLEFLS